MTSLPDDVTPESLRAIAADTDILLDRLDDTAKALLGSYHITQEQAFRLGEVVGQFGQAVRALKETVDGIDG